MEQQYITYEVDDSVAVISLDRAEKANAQNFALLHELNDCWNRAADDDDVHVIVMRANGKHFSAGHEMGGSKKADASDDTSAEPPPARTWDLAKFYRDELKIYLGYCLNWRNIPKPTIAAVQGKVIAAGLMLCWPCDLIIAADNAEFSDPVARMGLVGVEYHAHTWEVGARKAKEMLFTGRPFDAVTAERLGMVNRVVPLADLDREVMALAHEIAEQDPFAMLQVKRAVNQTLDIQGFQTTLQAVFDLHEMGHGVNMARVGNPALAGLQKMKQTSQAAQPAG
jgi:enoyl-CoA hydratase